MDVWRIGLETGCVLGLKVIRNQSPIDGFQVQTNHPTNVLYGLLRGYRVVSLPNTIFCAHFRIDPFLKRTPSRKNERVRKNSRHFTTAVWGLWWIKSVTNSALP